MAWRKGCEVRRPSPGTAASAASSGIYNRALPQRLEWFSGVGEMAGPGDAFFLLQQFLQSHGYETTGLAGDPQAFGSRWMTLRRGSRNVRLVCDGKDEWLILQTAMATPEPLPESWRDVHIERVGRQTASPSQVDRLIEVAGRLDAEELP